MTATLAVIVLSRGTSIMKIEVIASMLGQCEQIMAIIATMPEKYRLAVRASLAEGGVSPEVHSRNIAKLKNKLLNLNEDGYEPLAAISTSHVDHETLLLIDTQHGSIYNWGMTLYPNMYGAFISINADYAPAETAPKCMKAIYVWARRRDLQWIKLDADAEVVTDLPTFEDALTH